MYEKLKQLIFDAAQETFTYTDEEEEILERYKDFRYVNGAHDKTLLIGTSPVEMKAWERQFLYQPCGISLDKWDNSLIEVQDMHETNFADESFDFVYGAQVLEHSPAPILALKEIARVLKRGGRFFFWIPNDIENQKAVYHYSCFPKEIWETLFIKAGLTINHLITDHNNCGYAGTKA